MGNNYYLHAIILKGCPYSENALALLNLHKNIKQKITFIDYENKENYKTEQINTFPQIYLKKKNSNDSLLVGGFSELEYIFDNLYKSKYSTTKINNFIEKNKNWSKKATLRLIELIN